MSKVAETSRQSYQQIREGNVEKTQAEKIKEAIEKAHVPLTANELNKLRLKDLDIPNGRVAARLNKLKENGEVREAETREDQFTGRQAQTYEIVDQKKVICR